MLVPRSSSLQLPPNRRRLAVFGSTGSIGVSTLEIVRRNPELFSVYALAAGDNIETLADQICEFKPSVAVIANGARIGELKRLASDVKVEIVSGESELENVAASSAYDVMVAAIVGISGLPSVIRALESGKLVALANKESIVAGGEFVRAALEAGKGAIIPIDSEHSAIFQLLQGEKYGDVASITLTASGGPFLNTALERLSEVTVEDAVKHPRWNMGAKISIDSATMFNKALELIEAHWLFGLPPSLINVVIHPQSIIHSFLLLRDGVQLAHLSNPDMKGAISYALNYPHGRVDNAVNELTLENLNGLEFFALDERRFAAVNLARQALSKGGAAPAVLNIANEIAVSQFMQRRLKFNQISGFVADALERFSILKCEDLGDLNDIYFRLRHELVE